MNQIQNSPWTETKALSAEAKQTLFNASIERGGEHALYGRTGLIIGILGITGAFVGLIGMAIIAASVFPLKTVENVVWNNDQTTGAITRMIKLEDAPKTFTPANDHKYLRFLIDAREGWVWETDKRRDHIVKIMSTPDEQARYLESRKNPTHPATALAKAGHVEVINLRYFPQPDGANRTRSYRVTYIAQTWRGSALESSEPYTAQVDFQWHPELEMLPDDRDDNPGGFQALTYSANPDNPITRRQ